MNDHYFRLISFELFRYIIYNFISFVNKLIRELLLNCSHSFKRAELMSIRDMMSKEVYLSSNDERTFDEDSYYSLYPSYEAGFNIQSFATKLGDLKRPFSLPYESSRDGAHFSEP